jgi:Rps23 Pro-64 3,4-dihydroxylase Tpa1-like proline 4-hydroxylase
MQYKIYTEPFTYIVVEDLFGSYLNSEILKEAQSLIPSMKPGKVSLGNTNDVTTDLKSNSNIWLFDFYKKYPNRPNIARLFERGLWNENVKNIFKSMNDCLFRSILYTDNSQLLLSRYDKGDHYNWHRDYNDTLTMNYMFAVEPIKFKGGDFVLGSWDEKIEKVRIPFKNNSLVIFPSRVWHMVTPITETNGNSHDARFTFQYWTKLKHLTDA